VLNGWREATSAFALNCIVIVAAGENENDLNHSGLYSNKTVMVIIIKIYDRVKFLPVTTCKQNPS
jgi:hypothetical protein